MIAENSRSAISLCIKRAAGKYGKRYNLLVPSDNLLSPAISGLYGIAQHKEIFRLNIAGNRDDNEDLIQEICEKLFSGIITLSERPERRS